MGMAASPAVELAKSVYSQAGWLYICAFHHDDGQWPSDEVGDLLRDYVCEYGPSPRYFYADAHLTQQLARSYTIHQLREKFYGGEIADGEQRGYEFGIPEFFWATIDTLLESDWVFNQGPPVNVTHFLGSFEYTISQSGSDEVRFLVDNETELASGTRIPPILGGVLPTSAEARSVEEVIEEYPLLWLAPLSTIIDFFPIISILKPQTREETSGLEGGGTMEQVFVWREQYFACGLPSWPQIQSELETR